MMAIHPKKDIQSIQYFWDISVEVRSSGPSLLRDNNTPPSPSYLYVLLLLFGQDCLYRSLFF